MLYQWEISRAPVDEILDGFWQMRPAAPTRRTFASGLLSGVVADVKAIDRLIGRSVKGWRLERLTAIDRSILRLAVFELAHAPDTPPAVVIDEALELAKRFSVGEAVAFVNGILDDVKRRLEEKAGH